jgi:hypothetical protein
VRLQLPPPAVACGSPVAVRSGCLTTLVVARADVCSDFFVSFDRSIDRSQLLTQVVMVMVHDGMQAYM